MPLHKTWTTAKTDSKAKFKLALKAKRDALERQIKSGDAAAKRKALDTALAEAGIAKGDDLDKYFTFKEDFGPNLDKLEKAGAANVTKRQALQSLTLEGVLQSPTMKKAMDAFAKRVHQEDFWLFITVGYKDDPVKAYDVYVKPGARLEINIDGGQAAALHELARNPAQLKIQGPALLNECRVQMINTMGNGVMIQFGGSPEAKAALGLTDVSALKATVLQTITSYRSQITGYAAKWSGIQPDFRQPLLDALTAIKNTVDTY